MNPRKPAKPKDCRQNGVCVWYANCKFLHDAKKCKQSDTTADNQLPLAID